MSKWIKKLPEGVTVNIAVIDGTKMYLLSHFKFKHNARGKKFKKVVKEFLSKCNYKNLN